MPPFMMDDGMPPAKAKKGKKKKASKGKKKGTY
jgi:hypothetical protein